MENNQEQIVKKCRTCDGSGLIEIMDYQCDEKTGHNLISFPTGKMAPCPECEMGQEF